MADPNRPQYLEVSVDLAAGEVRSMAVGGLHDAHWGSGAVVAGNRELSELSRGFFPCRLE